MNKYITRKMAQKLDMTIWEGNEGQEYARMQRGKNREHKLYGYVFIVKG